MAVRVSTDAVCRTILQREDGDYLVTDPAITGENTRTRWSRSPFDAYGFSDPGMLEAVSDKYDANRRLFDAVNGEVIC